LLARIRRIVLVDEIDAKHASEEMMQGVTIPLKDMHLRMPYVAVKFCLTSIWNEAWNTVLVSPLGGETPSECISAQSPLSYALNDDWTQKKNNSHAVSSGTKMGHYHGMRTREWRQNKLANLRSSK
jgi:hypothetical protein